MLKTLFAIFASYLKTLSPFFAIMHVRVAFSDRKYEESTSSMQINIASVCRQSIWPCSFYPASCNYLLPLFLATWTCEHLVCEQDVLMWKCGLSFRVWRPDVAWKARFFLYIISDVNNVRVLNKWEIQVSWLINQICSMSSSTADKCCPGTFLTPINNGSWDAAVVVFCCNIMS